MSEMSEGPGATAPDPSIGTPAQTGMFGVTGTGDTSGFSGLVRHRADPHSTPPPYGSYFDEVTGALEEAYPQFSDAIYRVVVDRGELTLYVQPDKVLEVCTVLRNDPALRFEMCSSVSGVDYLDINPEDPNRLHAVYHLTSMTYRRRIRLETAVPVENPHVASVTSIYPTADWQER
jgi:NADH-quinone oxidoreductase subunit C